MTDNPLPVLPGIAHASDPAWLPTIMALNPPALDLDAAKATAGRLLDAQCAAAITGGFTSSTLGAPNRYGSSVEDQMNLGSDMLAAATGGSGFTATITCSADGGATWADATHTAAQIAQLFGDCRAWRIACQDKHATLAAAVANAADLDAVAAVTWS